MLTRGDGRQPSDALATTERFPKLAAPAAGLDGPNRAARTLDRLTPQDSSSLWPRRTVRALAYQGPYPQFNDHVATGGWDVARRCA